MFHLSSNRYDSAAVFFVAVTINPWMVLLDQSQEGPRFKVTSLQKLGHSASVVVVISMIVQYILEVIEDPIIWNVSFSLNWREGKNVQVHLLFSEMFIWWYYFASMNFPRAYIRYLLGCVLWFVSPTSDHQLPTWSVWIQVKVPAGAELVGVCSVTWIYPKVDLKRGRWFEIRSCWWRDMVQNDGQGTLDPPNKLRPFAWSLGSVVRYHLLHRPCWMKWWLTS